MEELIKISWLFKGEVSDDQIEKFFSEYISKNYAILDSIAYASIADRNTGKLTGEKVKVAHVLTTRENFEKFKEFYGSTSTIREGWEAP